MKIGRIAGTIVLGPRAYPRGEYCGERVAWSEEAYPLLVADEVFVVAESAGGHAMPYLLVPVVVCGEHRYSARGRLIEASGCQVDADHTETPGGRRRDILGPLPAGVQPLRLSAPERRSIEDQLRGAGLDPAVWLVDASVHGAWKLRRNQAVAWIRDFDTKEEG